MKYGLVAGNNKMYEIKITDEGIIVPYDFYLFLEDSAKPDAVKCFKQLYDRRSNAT